MTKWIVGGKKERLQCIANEDRPRPRLESQCMCKIRDRGCGPLSSGNGPHPTGAEDLNDLNIHGDT